VGVSLRRLFIAVDLDEAARRACAAAAASLRSAGVEARWVAPENYHITVAFLGGVDAERVDDAQRILARTANGLRTFDIGIEIVGAFPNQGTARVIWAGPRRPVPEFGATCRAVREGLSELGFALDDTHDDPHVTLARAAGRLPPLTFHRAQLRVRSLALYESFTEPRGARYVRLVEVGFGAGNGGGLTQRSEIQ